MGSPASVLEIALYSIFKQMGALSAGGDAFFEKQIPMQVALFASTYLVTVPGSPPVKAPIAANASIMQEILSAGIESMGHMDAGGDALCAKTLANSIHMMCQAGASSVGGVFTGAANVGGLTKDVENTFLTKDDVKIAKGISKAVEVYLKASGAS